jgi:hypothetical protein
MGNPGNPTEAGSDHLPAVADVSLKANSQVAVEPSGVATPHVNGHALNEADEKQHDQDGCAGHEEEGPAVVNVGEAPKKKRKKRKNKKSKSKRGHVRAFHLVLMRRPSLY